MIPSKRSLPDESDVPMNAILEFLRRTDGPTSVEYAVLLASILLMCIGAITMVGGGTGSFWQNNSTQLTAVLGGS